MTFQFLDNGERLFVFSKDAIIIRFGRNGDKSYALLIGLCAKGGRSARVLFLCR